MTTADFRPTHVVPQDGLSAWEAPDVNRPTTPLDALLPVQLVDRLGDWARIVCANDWSAWVDGRLLIAVPADPPAAGHPLTRTADPAPLLARTEAALTDFRRATRDLAAGETDADTFRQRTRGLRVGVVVDGDAMWLYDAEHERWVYCDGARLSTYAVGETPSVDGNGADGVSPSGARRNGPEPTQVVAAADSGWVRAPEGQDGARAVPRGSGGGMPSGGGAGPEPTQVVAAADPGSVRVPGGQDGARREPPGSGVGLRSVGGAGPEPTQVVAAADPGSVRVPDGQDGARREPPGSGVGMRSGGAVGPEATQVVAAADPGSVRVPGGQDGARREPPGSGVGMRSGGAVGPEATQVVEDASGAGSEPGPYAEEATRRIPPGTADPGPPVRSGDV
ncbi:hypothetical protein [Streptomyces sp. NPDC002853]